MQQGSWFTDYKKLLRYVDIKDTGGILLGKNFVVDGHWNRLARVITHAHSDHLLGLSDSIRFSSVIIATPLTSELIIELSRLSSTLKYLYKRKVLPLEYNRCIEINGEYITLVPANHIYGSAQVLVEIEDENIRLGYTGDFKLKGTPIMKDLDVLVIESTYGKPEYRRPFKDEVEQLLVDTVIDGFNGGGPVTIYGYYGKLQEAMRILREHGVYEPFLMTPKMYRITKIVEKYGYRIGEYYNIYSREGKAILSSTSRYILFQHMSKASQRNLRRGLNIVLSGWEFNAPIRRIDSNTWLIALSDHADYDELLKYVEQAQPKLVVVDNSRQGEAYYLAQGIRKELGIEAIVLPSENKNLISY